MTQFLGNLKLLGAFLHVVCLSAPAVVLYGLSAGYITLVVGERRHSALYVYFQLNGWGKSELFWHIKPPPHSWAVPHG